MKSSTKNISAFGETEDAYEQTAQNAPLVLDLPTIQEIPIGDLHVDPSYQRILNEKVVEGIYKYWDDALFQVLDVSAREDEDKIVTYWVIDGQHRYAAALQRGVKTLPARVHLHLTPADEALLFVDLQRSRHPLSALDLFWALKESKFEAAERIYSIATEHNLIIARKIGAPADRTLIATESLMSLYRMGEDVLEDTLTIVDKAWNGEAQAVQRKILTGLGYFIKTFRKEKSYDVNTLIEAFKGEDLAGLVNLATARSKTLRLPTRTAIARVLLEVFNKSKKGRKFPGRTFILAEAV